MILRSPIAGVLIAEAVALAAALTLVADFRAHRVSENLGGVNLWGYRGPVMRQKVPDEMRLAVVGGNLAFGWGVAAGETLAPGLRLQTAIVVDRPGSRAHQVTAVNLGAKGLPLSGYAARLEHFAYLQPDIVCVFVDPLINRQTRAMLPREDSAVAAATGYVPMLPLVMIDKGQLTHSPMLERAGEALQGVDSALYRAFAHVEPDAGTTDAAAVAQTVRVALRIARGVVIILPPYTEAGVEVAMHQAVAAMAAVTFHNEPRVRVVDLGDVSELADDGLRLDGLNFSAGGHATVAMHVAPAVIDLVQNH